MKLKFLQSRPRYRQVGTSEGSEDVYSTSGANWAWSLFNRIFIHKSSVPLLILSARDMDKKTQAL